MSSATRTARVVAGLFLSSCLVCAQERATADAERSDAVRSFVARYQGMATEQGPYDLAFAPLHSGAGWQALVYLRGAAWCESGGCTLLVLDSEPTVHVVGEVTVANEPIRVLTTSSHGWRDLGVAVRGGGIRAGYEALVPFLGGHYANNASVSPARRVRAAAGEIVLARSSR